MKRRKIEAVENSIYNENLIKIDIEESGEYYFEIKSEITNDLAEAVAIMMRIRDKWNDKIWNTKIPNINIYEIDPRKSLYWLSGGHDEWKKLENYKKSWHESHSEFGEEFGMVVVSILKKSKTLKDIRSGFVRHLNMGKIYDFAIQKNLV
jgi:hypothetical protein